MTWDSEKQKEYMREYGRKNRAILREKKKQQIANNPEYAASLRRSKAVWRDKNKNYTNEYNKKRKANDPNFKLRMSLRTRLYQSLKGLKLKSAIDLLGCSIEEFKNYIANKFSDGMTWENHGEWELDHIKPLALFDLTNLEEQKMAFHFSNFQPLWKVDNRAKRDMIIHS